MSIKHSPFAKIIGIKIFILVTFLILIFNSSTSKCQNLYINEILSSNSSINTDPDYGEYSDWIEIYNSAGTSIDLTGFYLTDNLNDSLKWQIPTGTIIQPGGYLVFWADGKNNGLHTNFKLDKDGEQAGLFDASGRLVDSVSYGNQMTDISFGRQPDGAVNWMYFTLPTPNSINNSTAYERIVPVCQFSPGAGFYTGSQSVAISNPLDGVTIRYTLDGSEPTGISPIYTTPINISSTSVIRATAFKLKCITSLPVSNTFFINEPDFDLPVISLSTTPANFWDDTYGIYTNGTNGITGNCSDIPVNWNQDWERPISLEIYNETGEFQIQENTGTKIYGGCSRGNPQKSLAILGRSIYGNKEINYKLFKEKPITSFKNFVLRNSGNDWPYTMFRDPMMEAIVINQMDIDYQAYQPAVTFLNGEYWGIYNIREKINEHYIFNNTGNDPDNVELLEWNGDVIVGNNKHYNSMINFINSNDLSNDANYQFVEKMMDIDEYINYLITQIFVSNTDWPGNNLKYWRSSTEDGLWRWILYDLDFGFGIYGNSVSHNTLAFALEPYGPDWPNPPWSTLLFRKLIENNEFRNNFIQRFAYHLNTTFQPERVISIIDSIRNIISSEMPRHIARWGSPSSMDNWEYEIDIMRNYALQRPAFVQQHICQVFNLPGVSSLSINNSNPAIGNIYINNQLIKDSAYIGDYFLNVPVKIEAATKQGYHLLKWLVQKDSVSTDILINSGSEWKYLDDGSNQGTAWRNPVFDDSGWNSGFAELGYGDGDENTVVSFGPDENNKYITTYFRKNFTVDDASIYQNLIVRLMRDDGAVIYLNGNEILRSNIPDGDVFYDTYAITYAGGEDEYTFFEFQVDAGTLVTGTNIIAVEIHQNSGTSSDISFDLELVATSNFSQGEDTLYSNPLELEFLGNTTISAVYDQDVLIDSLYINEFSARNSDNIDWIEIYNANNEPVDIGGLFLTDSLANADLWQIPKTYPDSTTINPGSYLLLYADNAPEKGILHLGFKISSTGDQIGLAQFFDTNHVFIDSLTFGKQFENISFGRYPDGNDSMVYFSMNTPGSANIILNNNLIENLFINEFSANNNLNNDWIEIYNTNDTAVNIGGLFLTDSLEIPSLYRVPATYPDSTTIGPGEFLVLYADGYPGKGILHIGFRLRSEGEQIGLSQFANNEFVYIDSLTYLQQIENISFGRYPDGNDSMVYFNMNTPGSANIIINNEMIENLFINEFSANNNLNTDWIEIYNANNTAVNIGGLFLTDSLEIPSLYQVPTTYPDSTTIGPGEFLVLYADGYPSKGILHIGFRLRSEGEQIGIAQLYNNEIVIIDSLTFNQQVNDISYGRYPDGSNSLEFFNIATPGFPNISSNFELITNLYINEFLAVNSLNQSDWLEIYNANNVPVDIGGLFLTDSLNVPGLYKIPTNRPDSTTIPPGGFINLLADNRPEKGILHLGFKLNRGGEQIGIAQLTNKGFKYIDFITYREQITGISYGRYPDGNVLFEFFGYKTPGTNNISSNNIELVENLYINEFCSNDENSSDWVELYNGNDKPVDIGGLFFSDSLGVPSLWQIPVSQTNITTINPKGFMLLQADNNPEKGALHLGFKLDNSGEQILINQFRQSDFVVIDALSFNNQLLNTSIGRYPDGSSNILSFNIMTPGTPNYVEPVSIKPSIIAENITIYPNPTNGILKISCRNCIDLNINIYNITGQLIYKHKQHDIDISNNIILNLSSFESGMYIIKINKGTEIFIEKIYKK